MILQRSHVVPILQASSFHSLKAIADARSPRWKPSQPRMEYALSNKSSLQFCLKRADCQKRKGNVLFSAKRNYPEPRDGKEARTLLPAFRCFPTLCQHWYLVSLEVGGACASACVSMHFGHARWRASMRDGVSKHGKFDAYGCGEALTHVCSVFFLGIFFW